MKGEGQRSEPVNKLRLDLRVPATPRIVSEVRRAMGELELSPSVLEQAQLLVSELVTNSIRHAGLLPQDQIGVRAGLSKGRLRVEVLDGGHTTESPVLAGSICPAPGSQSGWGLYLVERVATRWGRGHGRYWFELELGGADESA